MRDDEAMKKAILDGPLADAEPLLARLLATGAGEAVLGELAGGLFSRERYGMALMIFAVWAERDANNPEPWSNLGLCLQRMGRSSEAREVLEHALALKPGFAAARNNLCAVYQHLGLHEEQWKNALLAVELQPGSVLALNNLGSALLDLGRSTDAREIFEQCLVIDKDSFEANFNLARVALDEGRHADAIAFLEPALAGGFGRARLYRDMIEYHLAYARLAAGRLGDGWAGYERGFSAAISPTIARLPARSFSAPRWDGRPLGPQQRLLIWREQGIGDELRFLSLLPRADLGAGDLILETEPRLVGMLQRTFPRAQVRAQQTDASEDYDFQLPVGSLPGLLMKDQTAFAGLGGWLRPAPFEVARFAQRLAPHEGKRKIGICWRSHKLGGARNKKYTELGDWHSFLNTKNAVFVNLQYGDCEAELVEAERSLGIRILRWQDVDLKDDLEAVLGLMQNLDLVVSPSTAVVPLAGALGRPTIYLGHPNWFLLGEEHRYPWFESVRPLVVAPAQPVSSALKDVPALATRMLAA